MPLNMEIIHGDCLEEIPKLVTRGVMADSVVCDPPYHLTPTVNRFGKSGAAPAKYGKDGAMARLSAGFMSAKWDGGDLAFRPETWVTVASVLRPGAFLVAFGGCRTYHRLTCAIEDAGFIIQDCLMFMFATGFPKRRDMLKPAYEPIVLAYKPGGKRTLQVDECRISTGENLDGGAYSGELRQRAEYSATDTAPDAVAFSRWNRGAGEYKQPSGRWPANICHDGSDEVVALFPESAGSQGIVKGNEASNPTSNVYGAFRRQPSKEPRADAGSASRFFMSAKAGAQDRWGSRHPTVKPVELMKWLVALVTPPGGTCLDPFAGSGTTAVAALATGRNAILCEREDSYIADIRERLAFYEGGGTHSVQAKNRNRKVDHGPLFEVSDVGI